MWLVNQATVLFYSWILPVVPSACMAGLAVKSPPSRIKVSPFIKIGTRFNRESIIDRQSYFRTYNIGMDMFRKTILKPEL